MLLVQAADEEERLHLQTLLSQAQASEAEAIKRATEATQQLSVSSAQHHNQAHIEAELQEVCCHLICCTFVTAGLVAYAPVGLLTPLLCTRPMQRVV